MSRFEARTNQELFLFDSSSALTHCIPTRFRHNGPKTRRSSGNQRRWNARSLVRFWLSLRVDFTNTNTLPGVFTVINLSTAPYMGC